MTLQKAILILTVVLLAPLGAQQHRTVSVREADGKRVERIRFLYEGDKALTSRDLRNAMRIQQGEHFSRRFYNSDLAMVLNLYRAKGYREAEITRKKLELDEKERLHITISLDSKELWIVEDVRVRGGAPFDSTLLLGLVTLKKGDDLNYGEVLEGERSLQIFFNQQGYPHARVRNEWNDFPQKFSAEVIYHVDPGSKMHIGEVAIEKEEQLLTRKNLIGRYLTFATGDLYNPEELARSRNLLARTGLFRSVFLSTPGGSPGDSLQPVFIRLQERKYISVGSSFFFNIAQGRNEPRVSGLIEHRNWLGRGARLGLNASWGRPLQGAKIFFTERDLMRSGADLTLSAGLSEEWSSTEVFADADDPLQYELLTTNDSVLEGLLIFGGESAVREYINTVAYDFRSVQRLWEISSTLSKSWRDIYQAQFAISWTRARTQPEDDGTIFYVPTDLDAAPAGGEEDGSSDPDLGDDDFDFGDDDFDFGDDDFDFGDDDFDFGDDDSGADSSGSDEVYIDYSDGEIPVDDRWSEILTDRSRSINFTTEFLRDSRDNQISPTRGAFMRLSGLYAIKLGSRSTYVLDGEMEVRRYQPLSDYFVLAVAAQVGQTASLRKGRALPRVYWKEYGGEGSLRGVERNKIQAIGGGRTGLNLRAELRFQAKAFGAVGFWDRARVWRHTGDIKPADILKGAGMVDGYGVGLRYVVGFPFRFDLAFNDGFDKKQRWRIYFSIGQAF